MMMGVAGTPLSGAVVVLVVLVMVTLCFPVLPLSNPRSFSSFASAQTFIPDHIDRCRFGFLSTGTVSADDELSFTCAGSSNTLTFPCSQPPGDIDCPRRVAAFCNPQQFCSCTSDFSTMSCTGPQLRNWPDGLSLSVTQFTWQGNQPLSAEPERPYVLRSEHFRPGNAITSLTLRNTGLVRIRPDVFELLPSLLELVIENEPLTSFPWGQLPPSIISVRIANTLIGGAVNLDFIFSLPNLRSFALTTSQIQQARTFNVTAESTSLESLDLSNNLLTNAFNLAPRFPALRELDLSRNFITGLPYSTVDDRAQLEFLNVSRNDIGYIPFGFFNIHGLFGSQPGDPLNVDFDGNPSQCSAVSRSLEINPAVEHTALDCSCLHRGADGTLRMQLNAPYCPFSNENYFVACSGRIELVQVCDGDMDCIADEATDFCGENTFSRLRMQRPQFCLHDLTNIPRTQNIISRIQIDHGIVFARLFIHNGDSTIGDEIARFDGQIDSFGQPRGNFSFVTTAAGQFYGHVNRPEKPSQIRLVSIVPKSYARLYLDEADPSNVCDFAFGASSDLDEVDLLTFDFPEVPLEADPGALQLPTTAPFMFSTTLPVSLESKSSSPAGAIAGAIVGTLLVIACAFVVLRRSNQTANARKTRHERQILHLIDQRSQSQFANEYKKLALSFPGFERFVAAKLVQSMQIRPSSTTLRVGSFGRIANGSLWVSSSSPSTHQIDGADDATDGPVELSSVATLGAGKKPVLVLVHDGQLSGNTVLDVDEASQINFLTYARVLLALSRHPNVLKVEAIAIDRHPLAIATERLSGGNLFDYLRLHGKAKRCQQAASLEVALANAVTPSQSKRGGFKGLAQKLASRAEDDSTIDSNSSTCAISSVSCSRTGPREGDPEPPSQYFKFLDLGPNQASAALSGADRLSKANLMQVLHKIASALTFVESKGIVHRDLSLLNVHVDDTLTTVRVGGFAQAQTVYKSDTYLRHHFLSGAANIGTGGPTEKGGALQTSVKKSPYHKFSFHSKKVAAHPVPERGDSIALMQNPLFTSSPSTGKLCATTDQARVANDDEAFDSASPLRYCAPEVLEDGDFSIQSDVYAFGVMMWEVLHYGRPFLSHVPPEQLLEVLEAGVHLSDDGCTSASDVATIRSCLAVVRSYRPTFFQLHSSLSYAISGDLTIPAPRSSDPSDPADPHNSSNSSNSSIVGDGRSQSAVAMPEKVPPPSSTDGVIATSNSSGIVARRRSDQDEALRRAVEDGSTGVRLQSRSILNDAWLCLGKLQNDAALFLVRKNNPEQLRRDMNIISSAGISQILQPVLESSVLLALPQGLGQHPGLLFRCPRFTYFEAVAQIKKPAMLSHVVLWLLEFVLALERLIVLRCNPSYVIEEGGTFLRVSRDGHLALPCVPTVVAAGDAVVDLAVTSLVVFQKLVSETEARLYRTSKALGQRFSKLMEEVRKMNPSDGDAKSELCRLVLLLKGSLKGGLEISWSELEFVKVLGSGQFGEVQLMRVRDGAARARSHSTPSGSESRQLTAGLLVAVKTLLDPSCEGEFAKEMQLMTKIHHSNLLTLQHIITNESPKALVLEYLPNGSLDEWLRLPTTRPTLQEILFILYQVACGCAELERIGIVHRDIAARNVLLGFNLEAKLSDYGLSRQMTTSGEDSSMYYSVESAQALPIRWVAPEVLTSRKFDTRSDVYAYGMLLYEVISGGRLPFDTIPDQQLIGVLQQAALTARSNNNVPMQPLLVAPSHCNPALETLFYEATQPQAQMRLTFSDIIAALSPHNFDLFVKGIFPEIDTSETHL